MNNSVSYAIKQTKEEYSNNKGNAFVAAIVPGLIGAVVNMIVSAIIGGGYVSLIIQMFISAAATYMSVKMLMDLVRTKTIDFGTSLSSGKNLLSFIGVLSVFGVFQIILNQVLTGIFVDDALYTTLVSALENQTITNEMAIEFFMQFVPVMVISFVVISAIQIKFYLTQYYVVDGVDFIAAFQRSFSKTKGHVVQIILFFLYFIALGAAIIIIPFIIASFAGLLGILIMLGVLVYFIGFFIPYMMVGQVVLYEIIDGRYNQDSHLQVEDPFEGNSTESKTDWDF